MESFSIGDKVNLSVAKRLLLEKRLRGEDLPTATTRTFLKPTLRPDVIPLSFSQRRLWFLSRLEQSTATYNIPLVLRLTGHLDKIALQVGLGDVVERHESLLTIFPEMEGMPRQQILDSEIAGVSLSIRLSSEATVGEELAMVVGKGFDLSREIPLRAHLFELSATERILLLVVH